MPVSRASLHYPVANSLKQPYYVLVIGKLIANVAAYPLV